MVYILKRLLKRIFRWKNIFKSDFLNPKELAKNRDALRDLDQVDHIREHDIPFYRRYLIDRDVIPMTEVKACGEKIDSFFKFGF